MTKSVRSAKAADTATQVVLYRIAYSEETAQDIEPGYLMLDNLANERPDWFEYWPIRRFLQNERLDESAFYGFFSPKFLAKTGLDHSAVVDFVRAKSENADVVLFSPQADMNAFFLNVFEQAETFDAGMIATYEAFLARIFGRRRSIRRRRNERSSCRSGPPPFCWRRNRNGAAPAMFRSACRGRPRR